MTKFILLIVGIELLLLTVSQCQELNDTVDTTDNSTEIIKPKPFVYYGRYHPRRTRRESVYKNATSDLTTFEMILSILPLDRLGAIIGQIMATSLKEIFNPAMGKKIINLLENQAPSLLTSLFANLLNTLRVPARSLPNNLTISSNKNANKSLSNSSTSTPSLLSFMRRPRAN